MPGKEWGGRSRPGVGHPVISLTGNGPKRTEDGHWACKCPPFGTFGRIALCISHLQKQAHKRPFLGPGGDARSLTDGEGRRGM